MTKRDAQSQFGALVEVSFAFLIEDGRFIAR
jgi:hypothetical protein